MGQLLAAAQSVLLTLTGLVHGRQLAQSDGVPLRVDLLQEHHITGHSKQRIDLRTDEPVSRVTCQRRAAGDLPESRAPADPARTTAGPPVPWSCSGVSAC